MKILILNDIVAGGGVENVIYNLINFLKGKNEYDISFMTLYNQREVFEKIYSSEIDYDYFYYNNTSKRYSPKWFVKKFCEKIHIKKLLSKKYDVVLVLKEGPTMIMGSKVRAHKKFAWVHIDFKYFHWTKSCFSSNNEEVDCMKKYDKIICVSAAAKTSIIEVIGDPCNLDVKFNPVDVDDVLEKSRESIDILEEYMSKRNTNRPILVSVGRLSELKGYERLINCCAKLNEKFNYELWLVGEGEDRTKLEAIIAKNKLDNVILWGNQPNPFPFVKKANWFVCSSISESYGLALQEALIIGTPVLTTMCPSFEECISNDEAIFVENSEDEIYLGIKNILENPSLQERLKEGIDNTRNQENFYSKRLESIENLWKK